MISKIFFLNILNITHKKEPCNYQTFTWITIPSIGLTAKFLHIQWVTLFQILMVNL